MILKLTSVGATFLLEDAGVLIEAAPGSTFEDTNLLLDLSQSKALQAKILSGDVIASDGTSDFIPSAGLQYLASIWSQGGLSTVVRMASALSTGLLFGGILSINAGDNTKFDISAGGGIVVDNYSDPANPTLKYVEWGVRTGIADPYIAASTETYIYIDERGDFTFDSIQPTCIKRREAIHIGWTSHPDYLTLTDAYTEPVLAIDAINQMVDFFAAMGPFNIFGNEYAPQVNLKIQRSAGALWDDGANYKNNPKQPNIFNLSAESPVADIWYFYRDPGDPSKWNNNLPAVGDIDPDNYDDGSGVLAAVPVGKFTVQLLTLYAPWNVTDIQYGQVVYDTLAAAVTGVVMDQPVINPWNSAWDILRGWLVVQEGTTDLTDPLKAKFLVASKFGSIMGVGGGGTGGEANTASNQGLAGIGLFLSKVGVDLQFKNLRAASTKLTVTNNAIQKTVDVDLGPHKDSHKSGGSDALLSTDLIEAIVKRLQESSGPTTMLIGAVASGQFLRRSAATIVGADPIKSLLTWGASSVATTTVARYLPPGYMNTTAPSTQIGVRIPFAATIRNMYVRHNAGAGNGNAIVYTLRVNGIPSALTVSLASTATDGSDLVNSVAVVAGDLIDVEVTKAAAVGTSPTDVIVTMEAD